MDDSDFAAGLVRCNFVSVDIRSADSKSFAFLSDAVRSCEHLLPEAREPILDISDNSSDPAGMLLSIVLAAVPALSVVCTSVGIDIPPVPISHGVPSTLLLLLLRTALTLSAPLPPLLNATLKPRPSPPMSRLESAARVAFLFHALIASPPHLTEAAAGAVADISARPHIRSVLSALTHTRWPTALLRFPEDPSSPPPPLSPRPAPDRCRSTRPAHHADRSNPAFNARGADLPASPQCAPHAQLEVRTAGCRHALVDPSVCWAAAPVAPSPSASQGRTYPPYHPQGLGQTHHHFGGPAAHALPPPPALVPVLAAALAIAKGVVANLTDATNTAFGGETDLVAAQRGPSDRPTPAATAAASGAGTGAGHGGAGVDGSHGLGVATGLLSVSAFEAAVVDSDAFQWIASEIRRLSLHAPSLPLGAALVCGRRVATLTTQSGGASGVGGGAFGGFAAGDQNPFRTDSGDCNPFPTTAKPISQSAAAGGSSFPLPRYECTADALKAALDSLRKRLDSLAVVWVGWVRDTWIGPRKTVAGAARPPPVTFDGALVIDDACVRAVSAAVMGVVLVAVSAAVRSDVVVVPSGSTMAMGAEGISGTAPRAMHPDGEDAVVSGAHALRARGSAQRTAVLDGDVRRGGAPPPDAPFLTRSRATRAMHGSARGRGAQSLGVEYPVWRLGVAPVGSWAHALDAAASAAPPLDDLRYGAAVAAAAAMSRVGYGGCGGGGGGDADGADADEDGGLYHGDAGGAKLESHTAGYPRVFKHESRHPDHADCASLPPTAPTVKFEDVSTIIQDGDVEMGLGTGSAGAQSALAEACASAVPARAAASGQALPAPSAAAALAAPTEPSAAVVRELDAYASDAAAHEAAMADAFEALGGVVAGWGVDSGHAGGRAHRQHVALGDADVGGRPADADADELVAAHRGGAAGGGACKGQQRDGDGSWTQHGHRGGYGSGCTGDGTTSGSAYGYGCEVEYMDYLDILTSPSAPAIRARPRQTVGTEPVTPATGSSVGSVPSTFMQQPPPSQPHSATCTTTATTKPFNLTLQAPPSFVSPAAALRPHLRTVSGAMTHVITAALRGAPYATHPSLPLCVRATVADAYVAAADAAECVVSFADDGAAEAGAFGAAHGENGGGGGAYVVRLRPAPPIEMHHGPAAVLGDRQSATELYGVRGRSRWVAPSPSPEPVRDGGMGVGELLSIGAAASAAVAMSDSASASSAASLRPKTTIQAACGRELKVFWDSLYSCSDCRTTAAATTTTGPVITSDTLYGCEYYACECCRGTPALPSTGARSFAWSTALALPPAVGGVPPAADGGCDRRHGTLPDEGGTALAHARRHDSATAAWIRAAAHWDGVGEIGELASVARQGHGVGVGAAGAATVAAAAAGVGGGASAGWAAERLSPSFVGGGWGGGWDVGGAQFGGGLLPRGVPCAGALVPPWLLPAPLRGVQSSLSSPAIPTNVGGPANPTGSPLAPHALAGRRSPHAPPRSPLYPPPQTSPRSHQHIPAPSRTFTTGTALPSPTSFLHPAQAAAPTTTATSAATAAAALAHALASLPPTAVATIISLADIAAQILTDAPLAVRMLAPTVGAWVAAAPAPASASASASAPVAGAAHVVPAVTTEAATSTAVPAPTPASPFPISKERRELLHQRLCYLRENGRAVGGHGGGAREMEVDSKTSPPPPATLAVAPPLQLIQRSPGWAAASTPHRTPDYVGASLHADGVGVRMGVGAVPQAAGDHLRYVQVGLPLSAAETATVESTTAVRRSEGGRRDVQVGSAVGGARTLGESKRGRGATGGDVVGAGGGDEDQDDDEDDGDDDVCSSRYDDDDERASSGNRSSRGAGGGPVASDDDDGDRSMHIRSRHVARNGIASDTPSAAAADGPSLDVSAKRAKRGAEANSELGAPSAVTATTTAVTAAPVIGTSTAAVAVIATMGGSGGSGFGAAPIVTTGGAIVRKGGGMDLSDSGSASDGRPVVERSKRAAGHARKRTLNPISDDESLSDDGTGSGSRGGGRAASVTGSGSTRGSPQSGRGRGRGRGRGIGRGGAATAATSVARNGGRGGRGLDPRGGQGESEGVPEGSRVAVPAVVMAVSAEMANVATSASTTATAITTRLHPSASRSARLRELAAEALVAPTAPCSVVDQPDHRRRRVPLLPPSRSRRDRRAVDTESDGHDLHEESDTHRVSPAVHDVSPAALHLHPRDRAAPSRVTRDSCDRRTRHRSSSRAEPAPSGGDRRDKRSRRVGRDERAALHPVAHAGAVVAPESDASSGSRAGGWYTRSGGGDIRMGRSAHRRERSSSNPHPRQRGGRRGHMHEAPPSASPSSSLSSPHPSPPASSVSIATTDPHPPEHPPPFVAAHLPAHHRTAVHLSTAPPLSHTNSIAAAAAAVPRAAHKYPTVMGGGLLDPTGPLPFAIPQGALVIVPVVCGGGARGVGGAGLHAGDNVAGASGTFAASSYDVSMQPSYPGEAQWLHPTTAPPLAHLAAAAVLRTVACCAAVTPSGTAIVYRWPAAPTIPTPAHTPAASAGPAGAYMCPCVVCAILRGLGGALVAAPAGPRDAPVSHCVNTLRVGVNAAGSAATATATAPNNNHTTYSITDTAPIGANFVGGGTYHPTVGEKRVSPLDTHVTAPRQISDAASLISLQQAAGADTATRVALGVRAGGPGGGLGMDGSVDRAPVADRLPSPSGPQMRHGGVPRVGSPGAVGAGGAPASPSYHTTTPIVSPHGAAAAAADWSGGPSVTAATAASASDIAQRALVRVGGMRVWYGSTCAGTADGDGAHSPGALPHDHLTDDVDLTQGASVVDTIVHAAIHRAQAVPGGPDGVTLAPLSASPVSHGSDVPHASPAHAGLHGVSPIPPSAAPRCAEDLGDDDLPFRYMLVARFVQVVRSRNFGHTDTDDAAANGATAAGAAHPDSAADAAATARRRSSSNGYGGVDVIDATGATVYVSMPSYMHPPHPAVDSTNGSVGSCVGSVVESIFTVPLRMRSDVSGACATAILSEALGRAVCDVGAAAAAAGAQVSFALLSVRAVTDASASGDRSNSGGGATAALGDARGSLFDGSWDCKSTTIPIPPHAAVLLCPLAPVHRPATVGSQLVAALSDGGLASLSMSTVKPVTFSLHRGVRDLGAPTLGTRGDGGGGGGNLAVRHPLRYAAVLPGSTVSRLLPCMVLSTERVPAVLPSGTNHVVDLSSQSDVAAARATAAAAAYFECDVALATARVVGRLLWDVGLYARSGQSMGGVDPMVPLQDSEDDEDEVDDGDEVDDDDGDCDGDGVGDHGSGGCDGGGDGCGRAMAGATRSRGLGVSANASSRTCGGGSGGGGGGGRRHPTLFRSGGTSDDECNRYRDHDDDDDDDGVGAVGDERWDACGAMYAGVGAYRVERGASRRLPLTARAALGASAVGVAGTEARGQRRARPRVRDGTMVGGRRRRRRALDASTDGESGSEFSSGGRRDHNDGVGGDNMMSGLEHDRVRGSAGGAGIGHCARAADAAGSTAPPPPTPLCDWYGGAMNVAEVVRLETAGRVAVGAAMEEALAARIAGTTAAAATAASASVAAAATATSPLSRRAPPNPPHVGGRGPAASVADITGAPRAAGIVPPAERVWGRFTVTAIWAAMGTQHGLCYTLGGPDV